MLLLSSFPLPFTKGRLQAMFEPKWTEKMSGSILTN